MVPWLEIWLSMQGTPVPSLVRELRSLMDFPGGSDGKASVYNAGDLGSIPGSGRSAGEGIIPLSLPLLKNLLPNFLMIFFFSKHLYSVHPSSLPQIFREHVSHCAKCYSVSAFLPL